MSITSAPLTAALLRFPSSASPSTWFNIYGESISRTQDWEARQDMVPFTDPKPGLAAACSEYQTEATRESAIGEPSSLFFSRTGDNSLQLPPSWTAPRPQFGGIATLERNNSKYYLGAQGTTDHTNSVSIRLSPPRDVTSSFSSPLASSVHAARLRESKFGPLLRPKNVDEQRTKRHDQYMRQVKERGSARDWERRAESSLRRDFLAEQRAWAQEQAREAEAWQPDPEDEYEVRSSGSEPTDPAMQLDFEILENSLEGLELQTSLETTKRSTPSSPSKSTTFDSDCEEWELLMVEVAAQAEPQVSWSENHGTGQIFSATGYAPEENNMDISLG